MTGFGSATLERDGRTVTVELKSVNHRYLDPNIRMPRYIGFAEDTIRKALTKCIARGHVDVSVNYRNTRKDAREIVIDTGLLSAYLTAAREAGKESGLEDDITLTNALKVPDIMSVIEAPEDQGEVCVLVEQAVLKAAESLAAMRKAEGERLYSDLIARVQTIANIRSGIAQRAPFVVSEYKEKLDARVAALAGGVEVDKARLATEVALFADRANIDEELVRLASHVEQFKQLMDSSEPAGRKLDFIVQEMNREFNTMGSKANDVEIVNLVLEGKGEVEKIREQIQNIE
jgi:uncharacterized protein (TIGR00255 family)